MTLLCLRKGNLKRTIGAFSASYDVTLKLTSLKSLSSLVKQFYTMFCPLLISETSKWAKLFFLCMKRLTDIYAAIYNRILSPTA